MKSGAMSVPIGTFNFSSKDQDVSPKSEYVAALFSTQQHTAVVHLNFVLFFRCLYFFFLTRQKMALNSGSEKENVIYYQVFSGFL